MSLTLKIILREFLGSNLDTECFAEDLGVLTRREILANEMDVVLACEYGVVSNSDSRFARPLKTRTSILGLVLEDCKNPAARLIRRVRRYVNVWRNRKIEREAPALGLAQHSELPICDFFEVERVGDDCEW